MSGCQHLRVLCVIVQAPPSLTRAHCVIDVSPGAFSCSTALPLPLTTPAAAALALPWTAPAAAALPCP